MACGAFVYLLKWRGAAAIVACHGSISRPGPGGGGPAQPLSVEIINSHVFGADRRTSRKPADVFRSRASGGDDCGGRTRPAAHVAVRRAARPGKRRIRRSRTHRPELLHASRLPKTFGRRSSHYDDCGIAYETAFQTPARPAPYRISHRVYSTYIIECQWGVSLSFPFPVINISGTY